MRRADRLFQIVQFLRGGRLITAAQLAERLEVSLRTIYRDVADLMASGVPIEGEAGVGYVLHKGYDLPPLMFDREEIAALILGARMVRTWGGVAMAAAAQEALVKIAEVLPAALREETDRIPIHAVSARDIPTDLKQRLDMAEHAIQSRLTLHLDYADVDGTPSQRTVWPLGLFFWGNRWTLVAWCELRSDFRMFRLDRIGAATKGDPYPARRDRSLMAFFDAERRKGNIPADRHPELSPFLGS